MQFKKYPEDLSEQSLLSFSRLHRYLHQEIKAFSGPVVIGIGGPGGCGKSTLASWLRCKIENSRILSLDDFRLPRHERAAHSRFGSHPDANDRQALLDCLREFRQHGVVRQPVFNAETGAADKMLVCEGVDVLIADGEIAAHDNLRQEWDIFILVEAHWRTQLKTRLSRDINSRNCSLEKAIDIFLHSNLRDFPKFAAEARKEAQVVMYHNARRHYTLRKLAE